MSSNLNPSRRRALWIGTGAVGLAGAGVLAWTLSSRRTDAIRIGVGQPLSGDLAALGKDMLHGAQLAAEIINAEGGVRVGNRNLPIEIVAADDKANPEAGQAAAKQLVEAGVIAVIAHLNSGVSIAAAPTYAAAGVPQLAISTKREYTQLGLRTTLRLVANDDMQAQAMAGYAAENLRARRVALVDDGTPYGRGVARTVESVLKGRQVEVVVRRTLDDKTRDFAGLVRDIGSNTVDLVMVTFNDVQTEALLTQMGAAGLRQVKVLGGDTIKTPLLTRQSQPVDAVFATSPIAGAHEFPTGKGFVDAFRKRFGADPYYGSHYSHDAVHLIADALKRNASLNREALLERLKSFDGQAPVTGSLRMQADGEQRYGAVGVYRLRGGAWELEMRGDRW